MNNGQIIEVGWREWIALPQLSIPAIKAKVDTGARTSALHTFKIEPFREGGQDKVRFGIHPMQRRSKPEIWCTADVIDRRRVTDSGGHSEMRYVISTLLQIGQENWPIEITLTDRENMRFRMLLGRTAMRGEFHVIPSRSYVNGKSLSKYYRNQKK